MKKNKPIPPDGDVQFFEKLGRIKSAFGVRTDVQLAKAMGITQQAIASAKKKRKIPNTWLNQVMGIGVSADYILKGGGENVGLDGRVVRSLSPDVRESALSEIGVENVPLLGNSEQEQINALERVAAQNLVQLASAKSGIHPNDYNSKILSVFVMQHILPKNLKTIEDFMKEIGKIEVPESADK